MPSPVRRPLCIQPASGEAQLAPGQRHQVAGRDAGVAETDASPGGQRGVEGGQTVIAAFFSLRRQRKKLRLVGGSQRVVDRCPGFSASPRPLSPERAEQDSCARRKTQAQPVGGSPSRRQVPGSCANRKPDQVAAAGPALQAEETILGRRPRGIDSARVEKGTLRPAASPVATYVKPLSAVRSLAAAPQRMTVR